MPEAEAFLSIPAALGGAPPPEGAAEDPSRAAPPVAAAGGTLAALADAATGPVGRDGTVAAAAEALATGIRAVGTTGDPAIDGMLWGYAWSSGPSYAFPDSPAAYEPYPYGIYIPGYGYSDEPRQAGFSPVSAEQGRAIRAMLEGVLAPGRNAVTAYGSVEALTGLDLAFAGTSGAADLRIADTGFPLAPCWAYPPQPGAVAGDVWFSNGFYVGYDFRFPMMGDYFYQAHLHEMAHALGLKEASLTNNGRGPVPAEWDSQEFTVTSYRSHVGAPLEQGYVNEWGGFPQTFMMLDIAALQTLYGADFGTNAGDTTYRWSPSMGEMLVNGAGQGVPVANRIFLTVWDGGGTDTYDLSSYAGSVSVDLRPGGWSVLSGGQLARLDEATGLLARGNVFNAMQHRGDPRSLIENAIGGAGDDVLQGNEAGNALAGGAGDDALGGYGGADWIDGGPGTDRAAFRGARGEYALSPGAAGPGWLRVADLVAGRDGEDNLLGIEALEFTNPAIWRFYNLLTGVHFFTQSAAERDYVLASFPQFHFEGLGLRALSDTGSPGATPVFRFYNERTQAHFFTASAAERAWVAATLPQFHDEGIAFWEDAAGGAGLTPVYRFFNATTQAHFYTPSAAERDYIVATFAEWHAEGVAYHTPTTATDLMPLG